MKPRLILALAALLVLPGCYAMDIDARALEPHLYMNRETAEGEAPEAVSEFEARTKATWALWGLVDLSEPEVQEVLEQEIARASGSAVTNLEVVTQLTFVDGLLGVITLGLYGQRSTILRGTVVR